MSAAKEKALEGYLVASAKAGDRRAMSALIKLRGPRLMAHAGRLLGDAEVGRDLVQDAWAEILRGLPKLRENSAFLPWALRIVSRKVAREIKRRQRSRQLQADYVHEVDHVVEGAEGAGVDQDLVRAAVAKLSPDHRATIALFYLEDMSVAEVARALDVPIGTVKTRLMHARAKLRRALEGDDT